MAAALFDFPGREPTESGCPTEVRKVGTISLRNGQVDLDLGREHGDLVTVRHRGFDIDLVSERRLCENFRLLLPLPHRRGHYVQGSQQRLGRVDVGPDGTVATLEWTGLASDEGTFDVTFRMRIIVGKDYVEFRASVENNTSFTVEEVLCPAIGGIDGRELPGDWRIHHPGWTGQGVEWPVYKEFPGSYLGPADPVWFALYPRQMSMPWLDIFDASRRVGVTLADLDERPAGAMSAAFAQLHPCTAWRGGRQFWPTRREAGEEPVAMTLGWSRFPFVSPGARWESGPVVLRFHTGTWWQAAQQYRQWFDTVMPFPVDKRHSWLSRQDAWQSTIINYPEGTVNVRFEDLPRLAEAARGAGVHVLQLDGWHVGGIDRNYPDYRPDPVLGSEDDLRSAIARCRELGVHVLLFANLQWANIETDWYLRELEGYTVKDPRGFARNTMGWEYHTLLGLAGECESRMVVMDPAHEPFDRIITEQLEHTLDLGPDGLQIDKLGAGFDVDYAAGLSAGADEAVMKGSWSVLERLHRRVAARPGELALAGESHWDRALPFIDASYSRFFSETHLPTTAVAFPEFRQTNCVVGKYDVSMVNNCIRYGHVVNLEMRCLHGDASDAPELARYVGTVLSLRRELSSVLWDSRLIEPIEVGLELDTDEGLHCSVHRSLGAAGGAVVMNHFQKAPLKGHLKLGVTGHEMRLIRPGEPAEIVGADLDVSVAPDELLIITWGAAP